MASEKKNERIPREELVDNHPTGLELDDDDDQADAPGLSKPYDPTQIRVDPKMFSLRNILDMIEEGDLDLAPDFQRLKVWKNWQKSRLIESIFLRIPLPAFYFSSDVDGRLQVVDGVQRLSTIFDFVRGGANGKSHFALDELEYLQKELGGATYKKIEQSNWGKRLNTTQIISNVIDPQTPQAVKFDIFKRINTGGTPLTSQEIRHCMSGKRSRSLLMRLSQSDEFKKATSGKLVGHIRMADRELILRTLAFRIENVFERKASFGSLEELLNSATEKIDRELSDKSLASLEEGFLNSMSLATRLFGKHAFRKWPPDETKLYPINKALFEVWGVILADYSWDQVQPSKERIVIEFRRLFAKYSFFISSISSATGDPKKILYRFNEIKGLLNKCL